MKQVDFSGNVVCGVNSADMILCADNALDNPNWFYLVGALKYISVSNGRLYGVDSADM